MNASGTTLVIGAGPAGSSAACMLARAGIAVTLVERELTTQPKVCGEFISVEACAAARELGVDPFALGAAPIDRVRVAWGRAVVESRLPFLAASLSRGAFDAALLRAAERAGARVLRGTRALALATDGVTLRGPGGACRQAATTIVLATGKSEFGGERRSGGHFDALGFKMHLALPASDLATLGRAVELTLFDGGYYGMQRIEGDHVAFALVIARAAFARAGSWNALLRTLGAGRSRTAARLRRAQQLWPKPLAVSGVPYGFVYGGRGNAGPANVYRVGDQLAVIPSFTGDGLAIALASGLEAARAIARGDAPDVFHAAMRRRLRRPMAVAGALSRAIGTPLGRAAVVWPARVVPGLFAAAAALTRISPE